MNTAERVGFRQWLGDWIEPMARVGYAVNGITYIIVGLLALRAAFYEGGDAQLGRDDALLSIVTEPYGPFLLTVVALGLTGYALGHILMAFRPSSKERRHGIVALVNRGAHLGGGLIHLSLAFATLRLAITGLWNEGNTPQDWTAQILARPWGQWLIILVGFGILGVSGYEFYKAYTANFREVYRGGPSGLGKESGTLIGRIGYVARGVIYLVIGLFVFRAGWRVDADEAGGLGQALAALANQPYYGAWLLGAVAVGLIAYGLFGIFMGKYRDFQF